MQTKYIKLSSLLDGRLSVWLIAVDVSDYDKLSKDLDDAVQKKSDIKEVTNILKKYKTQIVDPDKSVTLVGPDKTKDRQ